MARRKRHNNALKRQGALSFIYQAQCIKIGFARCHPLRLCLKSKDSSIQLWRSDCSVRGNAERYGLESGRKYRSRQNDSALTCCPQFCMSFSPRGDERRATIPESRTKYDLLEKFARVDEVCNGSHLAEMLQSAVGFVACTAYRSSPPRKIW